MRADRDDVAPVAPAERSDLVVCSLHHSRRLAKFCLRKPVYNADRVMVGYTYQCREGMQCTSSVPRSSAFSQRQNSLAVEGRSDSSLQVEMTTGAPTNTRTTAADTATTPDGDALQQQQQPRTTAARGPNRYYDLTSQRGTGAAGTKKVCWNCGMEGHEKPECPNALCKVCHTTRSHHHLCQEPRSSPFVILSPALPLSEDMTSVQCVSCLSMGHFDCSTVTGSLTTSCCFCGEMGHNAYDCRRRKDHAPDPWVNRMLHSERGPTYGRHYNTHAGVPSYPAAGSVSIGYDQPCARRGNSDVTRGDYRHTRTRENDGYGVGSSPSGYYATNSRSYTDREPYQTYNRNKHDNTYNAEADRYLRRRDKRPRRDGEEMPYHQYRGYSNQYRNGHAWEAEGNRRGGERQRMPQLRHQQEQQHQQQQQRPPQERRRTPRRRDSDDDYDNVF
ncbi:putative nucleic acid binding protein [Trypanosoma grayi]|uniref:putative nucleic acid binding protein n=1 Tax=Trypanosoma grayi TaxID=71804 RepID=UPI0004F40E3B|nr:putative nucleic acid binding protein [Trypanosoma grayi]KEG11202.1 putative nucleic acid binding protein [Trypanosoma grayi]